MFNEEVTLSAVPVPTAGGVIAQPLSWPWRGLTLAIGNLTSDGILSARLSPPDSNWSLRLLRATGSDGSELRFDVRPGPPSDLFNYTLYLRPGTTNVDLTFGLQRERVMEVIAQPASSPAR